MIPCYNEEQRLDGRSFLSFVRRDNSTQLLFVDDGSTDGTAGLLEQLRGQAAGRVRLLTLEKNAGKAEAVRRGILVALEAGHSYVGFLDADLATPLQGLALLSDHLARHAHLKAVFGSRVALLGHTIQRGHLRHYLGRAFATMASLALRVTVYDTQCGAKVFRNCPEVRSVFATPFLSRWIFDVELLARLREAAQAEGVAVDQWVHEVPLAEWRHRVGSRINWLNASTVALDLYRIHRRYRYSRH